MRFRHSAMIASLAQALLACSDASIDSSHGLLNERAPKMAEAPEPASVNDSTNPRVVSGNPRSCEAVIPEADGLITFKVDPAKSGTYTSPDGELRVRIVASEKTFSFTSNAPLSWVIVKGGNGANIYTFAPPVTEATSLVAPRNAGLSHLDFCYGPPGGGGGTGGTGGGAGEAGTGGTGAGGSGAGGAGGAGGSGGSGTCPPDYQLWLATEGQSICTPIPNDGECPTGYVLDTASEGRFCIPAPPR
jgi:hypothetical protein